MLSESILHEADVEIEFDNGKTKLATLSFSYYKVLTDISDWEYKLKKEVQNQNNSRKVLDVTVLDKRIIN